MATKTAQADLFQAYGASQGEFPKVILAPCSPEESFKAGIEALEIAEKYQVVVIILMDLYLSEQIATIRKLDLKRKNQRFSIEEKPKSDFTRYKITKNGVSPRTTPGTLNGMHFTGSSERNEKGTSLASTLAGLPETLPIREAMVQKRMRKLDYLLKEIPEPQIFGSQNAEISVVTWGSTRNIVQEAINQLREEGIEANQIHIKYLNPFHTEEVKRFLNEAPKTLCVEQNFTGQLSDYLRMKTGVSVDYNLRRWDGEPITSTQVVEKVKEVIRDE
jgi:2-oxoglutarate ferredoxin oxidoreductase subunit alpha